MTSLRWSECQHPVCQNLYERSTANPTRRAFLHVDRALKLPRIERRTERAAHPWHRDCESIGRTTRNRDPSIIAPPISMRIM
jgi:hypothetical protein